MGTEAEAMKEQMDDMFDEAPANDETLDIEDAGAEEVAGGEETVIDGDKVDSQTTPVADAVVDGEAEASTDAVVAEANPEGVNLEVVDDIDAIRKRIADMSTPTVVADTSNIEGDGEVNPLDAFKEDVNYITEENLAGIADNPLLLNDAMNSVRRQTAENILNIVPTLISNAIQAQTAKTDMHNNFYGAHPELAPYKAYVSSVAKEVQAKMKDKTQEEILEVVAQSVKTSLQLTKISPAVEKKVGGKPALRVGKGGGRQTVEVVDENSMAAQISELLT